MEAMVKQVLAIRRQTLPPEHAAIAEALSRLGTIARGKFAHEQAVELHRAAVAMQRKLLGDEHPAVAEGLAHLSFSLSHIGRTAEARAAYREAFAIRHKVLGDAHPRTVATLVLLVGEIPAALADDDTLRLVRDFIAHQRQLLPPGAVALAPSLLALASLLDHPNRSPAAARTARDEARVLLEASRVHGPPLDVEIVAALELFGWWKFVNQAPAEGRTTGEEALALARAAYGPTSRGAVLANHILAWVYFGMGRADDAVAQFEEAVRVNRAVLRLDHPFVGMDVAGLGAAYRAVGRLADSRRVLEEILAAWQWGTATATPPPSSIATVLGELGLTLNQESRFADAERILREALRHYELGALPIVARRIRPPERLASELGRALAGQGKFAEAEPIVVRAYEELNASRPLLIGDANGMVAEALATVIAVYEAWGKPEQLAAYRAKLPAPSRPPP